MVFSALVLRLLTPFHYSCLIFIRKVPEAAAGEQCHPYGKSTLPRYEHFAIKNGFLAAVLGTSLLKMW